MTLIEMIVAFFKWLFNNGIRSDVPATPTIPPTVEEPATFGLGFFIDPVATPITKIDFLSLKNKGITEVYVRVKNADYTTWDNTLTEIKAANLKPYIWVWQGFLYIKYMTSKGWNTCMDMEKYDMENYYTEIKQVRSDSKGKTFILCTKAQDWDGNQKWSVIKDHCDYLMPMLYIGDYGKTITQLESYMKYYNTKFPNKIYPALETYISDANVVKKTTDVMQSEIKACKPYCKGLGLFRYGIGGI